MSVIVNSVSKLYGEQKALDDVSFTIEAGQVVGFLGPNGAGKSTMMKIISCFLPQTSGSVTVNGFDVVEKSLDVRRIVGYLPEHNPLYLDMYVREFLKFIAKIQLPSNQINSRIDQMIEETGLGDEQHKKINALSKGYRQRVGLAQAIIHDPQVLILDEPTTGLDPNQLVEIRALIRRLGQQKTVLLSTHIMQEVEAICDKVLIINKGKIVADDNTLHLRNQAQSSQAIFVEFDQLVKENNLKQIESVLQVVKINDRAYRLITGDENAVRKQIFRFAVEQNLAIITLKTEENTLENIFRDLTGEKEKEVL